MANSIGKMALLVARCTKDGSSLRKIVKNISGQVSIFFATTVVVLITFIAFIVNIGLFVKAKINLQNAVDAAAWSGASVQARQLTNIAYMNWEMRNVYKEWMFKYYVLGNLSLDVIYEGAGASADFTMETIPGAASQYGSDSYNFPSICINFAAISSESPNICRLYSIPGLPVFNAQNLVQVDQVTTALTNTLASSKMEACARRSALNFLTANLWAYNVKASGGLNALAPEIAPGRQGAFPQAFELALRIRSLEKYVNTPPQRSGVCANESEAAGNCTTNMLTLESQGYPGNERIVKAYHTGYRNLGNDIDQEMKGSFTLTEIPPQEVVFNPAQNLSNTLIPPGQQTKYYLDLKLMTLNYATFFTSFTSDTNSQISTNSHGNVNTTARCDASKIALPVPGYPLGFVKNPSVLTYYAVRGESNWVGLFNPFELAKGGIKLTAYAAAKPFGGRVGPMLFDVLSDETKVFPRGSTIKNVSSAYLMGLDLSVIFDWKGDPASSTGADFVSGAPLPLSPAFWVQNTTTAVGGFTQDEELVFAIPNIVYDYPNNALGSDKSYFSNERIDVAVAAQNGDLSLSAGLYNGQVLNKFRVNLAGLANGAGFGVNDIESALERVRGPTLYDVNNYLVPTPEVINQEFGVDSFGATLGTNPTSGGSYKFQLFAPLFSEHSLYQTPVQAINELNRFIDIQVKAVEKFRNAMNAAAIQISHLANPTQGSEIGAAAARGFSDFDYNAETASTGKPTCKSLVGKFMHFFLGPLAMSQNLMSDNSNCVDENGIRIPSLSESLGKYWTDNQQNLGEIYDSTYTISDEIKTRLFTAYRPGPLQDASPAGIWNRSIANGLSENMWRNFYSTKFVSMRSLRKSGNYNALNSHFPITSEGNAAHGELTELSSNYSFLNPLNVDALGIDMNSIFH